MCTVCVILTIHAILVVCTVHTMLVHQVHTTHTPYIWSTRHIQYQQYRNMLSMQHKPYIAQFPIDVHIDIHWYTSSSMGVQGDPWICISILGYHGRSTKVLGCVWISMYIYGYSLISMYIQDDACMCTHHQPYTIIHHLGGRLFVTTWSAICLSKDLYQASLENMFVCIFADFEAFRFCVVSSVAIFLLAAKFVLGESVGREASFGGNWSLKERSLAVYVWVISRNLKIVRKKCLMLPVHVFDEFWPIDAHCIPKVKTIVSRNVGK